MTVSADWIIPLRQELGELRQAIARSLRRPVPMPQAWAPGAPQQGYPQAQAQPLVQVQVQAPYPQPPAYPPQGQPQPKQPNQAPAAPPNQYPPPGWQRR
jgi:hypothetical protein